MASGARYWAAVPAAGIGARMGASVPKQYLALHGRPILWHTLQLFLGRGDIAGIAVAVAAADREWAALGLGEEARIITAPGGAERADSVLSCLRALAGRAAPDDWVLVHDAVRPCVRQEDISRLMAAASAHGTGGILALPVRDTMKRADGQETIAGTVDRTGLWHALTPQMFRLGALREALESAARAGRAVTDEAQAMELAGERPLLVRGHPDNIKITHADDLALAELFLKRREEPA
jgi:2-C-methyl-D-erythritol 4-phosphate cytidylyltransferase